MIRFLNKFKFEILWYFFDLYQSWNDCHAKIFKYTVFSSGSFCQIYRVTDEALIAQTAIWLNFFLMNVFFALEGSKRFIIISMLDQMTVNLTCLIDKTDVNTIIV